ncbi:MAG TPA: trimethylamine methyltransferase family protein [Anaerolineales bacterium]|nr:trimethylamine methyltransferase family protein [Anaerolineales bacterium]
MSSESLSRRRTDRAERRSAVTAARIVQPLHNLPTYELVSPEGLAQIHQASLTILSDIGIDFYDEESLAILKENGAHVKGETVFFDPQMLMRFVQMAPSQFTQLARNPANQVQIGGNAVVFAPVYGPPFVYDRIRGRREAKLEDFVNFVKMAYSSPYIHHSGGTVVEPTDEPTHTRHLDMLYAHIKYSDKPFMGSVTSAGNAADSVSMVEMLFGAEAIRQNPALISLINISSPRRLDDRMLGALKVYAKARQAMIITPFILSGAMAPVAIGGTLAQLNAEALCGIALAQMINPGTPVVMGAFQTNVDLQSGSPVFGSPESQIALFASAQLARMHGLPFRSGGMFASSKVADAQAAYESVMVMLPAILARVNFVLHAAGWLEGGLTAGYEKFVLDCEVLGMMQRFLHGLDLSPEGMAMESIRDVAPGGHHLGTDHTLRNFRTAFHRAEIFDYNSAEQWQEEGSRTAEDRATDKWKRMLRDYQAPELDSTLDQALQDFIQKRKREIPPEF